MYRRVVLPTLLLLLLASSTVHAGSLIIPVAGHLPGGNGTQWTTDLLLTNLSTAAQSVTLRFYPQNLAAATRDVPLAPGESKLLSDAVNPALFNAPVSSWLGQLEVSAPHAISATARIFTANLAGAGSFGSTYQSIDPAVMPNRGILTGLFSNDRYRTNIAFANASEGPVTIDIAVGQANSLAAAVDRISLHPHETRQLPLAAYVSDSPSAFSLRWSAAGAAFAVASVIDNSSGDPTAISSVAAAKTSHFFPLVGKTPGQLNTFWTTSISVTSDSASAGAATFYYQGNDGTTASKTISLEPYGTFSAADLFDLLGLAQGSGVLTIGSSVPIVAATRMYNTQSDGTTFGSAVLPQGNTAKASSVTIDNVRRDVQFRLNLAVANDNAQDASGTIRLFDSTGAKLEEHRFAVPGKSSAQYPINGSSVELMAGRVEIVSDGAAAIVALASNVDNGSGDTIMAEARQEAERQRSVDVTITPRTARVGQNLAMTARVEGDPAATFAWSFGDGAEASGASVSHLFRSTGEFAVVVTATLSSGVTVTGREDVSVLTAGGEGAATGIDFAWTPAGPALGETVTFSATFSGPPVAGARVKWEFPGAVVALGNPMNFTFPSAGTFEVEAELEQEGLPTLHQSKVVTVGGGGGSVSGIDFTWSPTSPTAGESVTFTATAAGNPPSGSFFKWKFPGDVRVTGNPVSFLFRASGSHEVELELELGGTPSIEIRKVVQIGGSGGGGGTATAIDFDWAPAAPVASQPVTFRANLNGTPRAGYVVRWEFPNDVRPSGEVVEHAFATPGTYEVEVELEQPGLPSISRKKTVTVGGGGGGGGALSIDFGWLPATPDAGQEITFTAVITGTPPVGASIKWEFPGNVVRSGNPVTHTFSAPGTYEVEVELEHGGPETIRQRKAITVGGGGGGGTGATGISFSWSPAAPRAGQSIEFEATVEGTPLAGSYIKWRFPDDSRPIGNPVSYTFATPGTYEVRVQIEQPGRVSIESERTVTVTP